MWDVPDCCLGNCEISLTVVFVSPDELTYYQMGSFIKYISVGATALLPDGLFWATLNLCSKNIRRLVKRRPESGEFPRKQG